MNKNSINKQMITRIIISMVVSVGLFFLLNYFLLIRISFRFIGLWIIVGMLLSLGTFLYSVLSGAKRIQRGYIDTSIDEWKPFGIGVMVSVTLVIIFLIGAFVSTPLFHATKYYELIGEVDEPITFTSSFDAVDTDDNLPVVDSSLARELGDKEFGKFGSLGSEFHVGEFHDLSVDGNLVAVAPLEYNGLFKWANNREGTPGFVIVDKFTGDVEIITEMNMKYMPSAYFETDLHRHIYQEGKHAKRYQLTDFALELDDDLMPYWVITALKPTIGLTGGKQVMGVYVVDPQSGEVNFYEPDEAPEWVDTVYPKDFVIEQLNYWGAYVDGFFNSFIGQKNVIQTTDGSRRVFNDDRVFHYTGLTSASADEATIGFVFVNTRTKEVVRYNMSGATETAAMESAEGIVQNFGYRATFPIPMNVYNEPTFLITLKDNKGLIKQFAFVNVSDFSKVGIGDSIDKAYSDYGEKLNIQDGVDPSESNTETITGTVLRISMSVVNGQSQYEILLDEGLYTARYVVSSYLSVTNEGDTVTIVLIGNTVIDFTNITLEGTTD